MNISTLDLKITFEGNETAINKVDDKLANDKLCQALSSIVQQTLVATGVSDNFTVNIQRTQIKKSFGQSGGLNANEWMDSD